MPSQLVLVLEPKRTHMKAKRKRKRKITARAQGECDVQSITGYRLCLACTDPRWGSCVGLGLAVEARSRQGKSAHLSVGRSQPRIHRRCYNDEQQLLKHHRKIAFCSIKHLLQIQRRFSHWLALCCRRGKIFDVFRSTANAAAALPYKASTPIFYSSLSQPLVSSLTTSTPLPKRD